MNERFYLIMDCSLAIAKQSYFFTFASVVCTNAPVIHVYKIDILFSAMHSSTVNRKYPMNVATQVPLSKLGATCRHLTVIQMSSVTRLERFSFLATVFYFISTIADRT